MTRILAIAGSLRPASYNRGLVRAAARRVPEGAELVTWDRLAELPPYDETLDRELPPEPVASLRAAIASADGVLIATPEYNASVPGVLKNAIDWASRPFPDNSLRGTPVALVGASTGRFGAAWAQADLKRILGATGARVIGTELPVPLARDRFDPDGNLLDAEVAEKLRQVLEELVGEAEGRPAIAA